jgi:hypothetical protein
MYRVELGNFLCTQLLSPRRLSGMFGGVDWELVTDVLGQPVGSIWDCLSLEDGTDMSCRKVRM